MKIHKIHLHVLLLFILTYLFLPCTGNEINENTAQPKIPDNKSNSNNDTQDTNKSDQVEYLENVKSWCWWIIPPILLATGTVGNTLAFLVMRRYSINVSQHMNINHLGRGMAEIKIYIIL